MADELVAAGAEYAVLAELGDELEGEPVAAVAVADAADDVAGAVGVEAAVEGLDQGFLAGMLGFQPSRRLDRIAAPILQVSPLMGSNLIIVVFAVVVIGGMGSILGSILTGLGLGVIEGFTKVFWPEASSTVVFIIMVVVLLTRPAGLFGKES